MKLFNKTLTRLQSLEEKIGLLYIHRDDYSEHIADTESYGHTLEKRIAQIEEYIKDNTKGKK